MEAVMHENQEFKIDPGHKGPQGFLRKMGPLILIGGIVLTAVGVVSVFAVGPSIWFACAFLGLPMIFVGTAMTQFGYIGRVARYMSQEVAPVGKDTFNYMADGTQEGVKTVSKAFAKGLSEAGIGLGGIGAAPAGPDVQIKCHKCSEMNDEDAKFCSNCGTAISKTKPCPQCDEINDPDARFCDNCGYKYIE